MLYNKKTSKKLLSLLVAVTMILITFSSVAWADSTGGVSVFDEFGYSLEDTNYQPTVIPDNPTLKVQFDSGATLSETTLKENITLTQGKNETAGILRISQDGAAAYKSTKIYKAGDIVTNTPTVILDITLRPDLNTLTYNGNPKEDFKFIFGLLTDESLGANAMVNRMELYRAIATEEMTIFGTELAADDEYVKFSVGGNTIPLLMDEWAHIRLVCDMNRKKVTPIVNGVSYTEGDFGAHKAGSMNGTTEWGLMFGGNYSQTISGNEAIDIRMLKLSKVGEETPLFEADFSEWSEDGSGNVVAETGVRFTPAQGSGANHHILSENIVAKQKTFTGTLTGNSFVMTPVNPLIVGETYTVSIPAGVGGAGFPATDKQVDFIVVGGLSELDRAFVNIEAVRNSSGLSLTSGDCVDINNNGFQVDFDNAVDANSLSDGITLESFQEQKVMKVSDLAWKTSRWTLPEGWVSNGDNTLTIEVKVRMDEVADAKTGFYCMVTDSGIPTVTGGSADNARVNCIVETNGDATISSRGGSVSVEPSTWHTFKIVYNVADVKNEIYVDDVRQSASANSGNDPFFTGVDTKFMMQTSNSGQQMYLEYVKIYGDKHGVYIMDEDGTKSTESQMISGMTIVKNDVATLPFDVFYDENTYSATIIPEKRLGYNYTYSIGLTGDILGAEDGNPILNPMSLDIRQVWAENCVVASKGGFKNAGGRLYDLTGYSGDVTGYATLKSMSGSSESVTLILEVTNNGEQVGIMTQTHTVSTEEQEYTVTLSNIIPSETTPGDVYKATLYIVDSMGNMNVVSPEYSL